MCSWSGVDLVLHGVVLSVGCPRPVGGGGGALVMCLFALVVWGFGVRAGKTKGFHIVSSTSMPWLTKHF